MKQTTKIQIALAILVYVVKIVLAEQANKCKRRGRIDLSILKNFKSKKMKPNTTNVRYYELTASEFDWKISEEKTVKAWGFNNSIPGPVLKANKGDMMVIKVKNDLREATVVHWHGIRLPSSMDGTDDVQNQFSLAKNLNTDLLFLMQEHSGITLIKMKPNKWKEECMVL